MTGRTRKFRYLYFVYIILVLVMFILPFYSVEDYSILKNTTSQLGAQHSANAWIMNTVFVLLGSACIMEGWLYLKNYWMHKIVITIFGAALILMAFFQHAPIAGDIPYSQLEDTIHSILASTIGFSFTVFAVSAAFIEEGLSNKILALLMAALSILFSFLMFTMTDYTGLWQRCMFLITFAWMVYFFEGMRKE